MKFSLFYKPILCLLMLIMSDPSGMLHAQQRLAVKHYDGGDGFTGGNVMAVVQDSKGFIWIGTGTGLFRYDGMVFDKFTKEDGLVNDYVHTLYESDGGYLLIGTYKGLSIRKPDGSYFNLLPFGNIRRIFKSLDGSIVIAGAGFLAKWQDETMHIYDHDQGLTFDAEELSQGDFLMTCESTDPKESGIFRLRLSQVKPAYSFKLNDEIINNESERNIDATDNKVDRPLSISAEQMPRIIHEDGNLFHDLARSADGKVWVGSEHGVYLFDENENFKKIERFPNILVRDMTTGSDSITYILAANGMLRIKGEETDILTAREGLPPTSLTSVFEDREGNLWIGSFQGLSKVAAETFLSYPKASEYFNSRNVLSIFTDYAGRTWFHTADALWVSVDGKLRKFDAEDGLESTYLYFVGASPSGSRIWLRHRSTVGYFDSDEAVKGNFKPFYFNERNVGEKEVLLHLDYPDRYLVTKDGSMLLGNIYGAYISDGGAWKALPSMACKAVTSFMESENGEVWATNWCGVARLLPEDKFEQFGDFRSNKDTSIVVSAPACLGLSEDKLGHLIVQTMGKGIVFFHKEKGYSYLLNKDAGFASDDLTYQGSQEDSSHFILTGSGQLSVWKTGSEKLTVPEPFRNTYITRTLVTDDTLWMASVNGLYRYDKKSGLKRYTTGDGLLSNNINSMSRPGNGGLWVSVEEGVSMYRPGYDKVSTLPPPVVIRKLLINKTDSSSLLLNDEVVLDYGHPPLEITYSALSFIDENLTTYSYRMKNLAEEWSAFESYHFARFAGLAPGTYVFEVRAKNKDGVLSEKTATLTIRIKAPFWMTWWFRGLIFLCLLGVLFPIYRGRIRYIQKKNEKLERLVDERTKEVQLKHAELVQQKEEIITQAESLKEANTTISKAYNDLAEQGRMLEKQNKHVMAGINYAKRIQEAILPPESQFADHFKDHFLMFKPRDIVSGDFYYLRETEEFLILAAADCTGHGVPGGFMSMIAYEILNDNLRFSDTLSPGGILEAAHQSLIEGLRQQEGGSQDGMDIALLFFDRKSNRLVFSGAQNPLYHYKAGEKKLHVHKATRRSVGGKHHNDIPFEDQLISLNEGDMLYLATDGYQDQFGGTEDRKFMKNRFRKLLGEIAEQPVTEQREVLESRFENWKGNARQIDDVLVIGIQV